MLMNYLFGMRAAALERDEKIEKKAEEWADMVETKLAEIQETMLIIMSWMLQLQTENAKRATEYQQRM